MSVMKDGPWRSGPPLSYRMIGAIDARLNRVFTQRWNPLYQSGAIALMLLVVLLVTGLYLLIFYRIGSPWASVARIDAQWGAGRWIRALHRFASDAVLVAAGLHAFRMYAQRRTWGPRALAWLSGVALVVGVLVSGWTGFVLVWDSHAQVLAVGGARLLDALPIFSEPIGRSFNGERPLPSAFFFLNLFAHIALPTGLGVIVWVHVARVARPVLVPARPLLWTTIGGLVALSILWPVPLAPAAELLRTPADVPFDWFFGWWLPLTQVLPAWAAWVWWIAAVTLVAAVAWLTRPPIRVLPAKATVNPRTCTGCEQCVHDCPYEAIEMVAREDGRAGLVAHVTPELCTACGVCVGSCPPMAIGPFGETARDQIARVRAFIAQRKPDPHAVVIVGCTWGAARQAAERQGREFIDVACVGSLHTSSIEILLRSGVGGVLVAGCPTHDGRTREGVAWARERLFQGRTPELKDRVNRSRLRLIEGARGESEALQAAARELEAEIRVLDAVSVARQGGAPDLVSLVRAQESLEESES